MSASDLNDIASEAGVIASLILNPELCFYSEDLTPHHFVNEQNGYMYYAICELAKRDIKAVDAYNITNILNMHPATKEKTSSILTVAAINEFIQNAPAIARTTVEEYKLVADAVVSVAFRRSMYAKLEHCKELCKNTDEQDLEQRIYSELDDVMMGYSSTKAVPQYKDVVDELWAEIENRQSGNMTGIPFKFPTLNKYASIERGELFIFAASAKQGKSMMLLNEAVDLMARNMRVLYIDSELSSRLFTARMISHLTKIEFNRLRAGKYSQQEANRIKQAINWIKSKSLTHIYMPMFDAKSIYTTTKKVNHTQGIDVIIIDYFKSAGDNDAFATYQELGRLVDIVKNKICGDMDIAGLAAAQATDNGRVADSRKIGRNASTIALIQDKTIDEIEADGHECGNKKLTVVLNRNGEQMAPGEYIDMKFNGNIILYEEAKQHQIERPY